MTFRPGVSGNPSGKRRVGRPKAEVARAALREAISKGLPAVVVKLQTMAEGGDTNAARLLLERGLPQLKPAALEVGLPEFDPAMSNTDAARAVFAAIASGKLPPDVGAQLITALGAAARVAEIDELAARIAALESRGLA
ncbi:DUF5681 domain-containing protein [Variovorax sp. LARHSF232]